MAGWLRSRVFDLAARMLTKPRGNYNLLLPNDLDHLYRHLRVGDVILVDGEQRVSEVIKFLTQSSWSHVALYVGDEITRRFPERRAALTAKHGADVDHLVIEALMEGVVPAPIAKYANFNLRVCRPIGLRRDDLGRILDEVLAQLGQSYDVKHIVDLARYFFPVSLIPRRFRRRALQFGSGLPTQVICSSMIGRAFQNVGFPILPALTPDSAPAPPPTWLDRVLRRKPPPYSAVFRRQLPAIITPRDFDLSPYFEIVKINFVDSDASRFDYRRIRWADHDGRAVARRTSRY